MRAPLSLSLSLLELLEGIKSERASVAEMQCARAAARSNQPHRQSRSYVCTQQDSNKARERTRTMNRGASNDSGIGPEGCPSKPASTLTDLQVKAYEDLVQIYAEGRTLLQGGGRGLVDLS
jgi:hypothetical protein